MCIIFTYLFALLIHKKCPLPYLFQTPKLHNYIQNKYLISTFLRILTPIITFPPPKNSNSKYTTHNNLTIYHLTTSLYIYARSTLSVNPAQDY